MSFLIDAAPFQVAVARAEAKLAQVRTGLAATKASSRAKQAEMTLARTRYVFVRKDQQRQADLIARDFIPASTFDDAQQTTDLARQQIGVLQQDVKRIAEILGGSVDALFERHPSYLGALALVVNSRPWIEANFPETDLTYVHPGRPVAIHIDTYPSTTWPGVVESSVQQRARSSRSSLPRTPPSTGSKSPPCRRGRR